MNIQPIKADLQHQDWQKLFKLNLPDRGRYLKADQQLSYLQITGRFLGCFEDEEAYVQFLYEYITESKETVHLLNKELDKTITNDKFQAIQKIMNIHNKENGLSANRFVAFLDGAELLPLKENKAFYRHYQKSYIQLLKQFKKNHDSVLHADYRRIVVDSIKWSWNHIDKWVQEQNLAEEMPRVVWYGDASKSEAYFLYFLIILGFDVLIFHPEGKDVLKEINQEIAPVLVFPSEMSLIPFPETKPDRKSTVAKKASAEMEETLHSEDSLLYRPWQLRSYIPQSITLETTYDEIFLIMREKAFIRPNFEAKNQNVYIPAIFSKVLGISINKKEYWSRIHELADREHTLILSSFPFSKTPRGNQQYHYQEALTNGKLDPKKMMKGNWWRYKHLPEGLQKGLASAISRYVDKACLKREEHETEEQTKLYLFTAVMDIPEPILKLLQQFDYAQSVPGIVIYNNGSNGELSRGDSAMLLLLNEFGADILLYNPTAQNDIELYIDNSLMDSHWLEEVSFTESFEKQDNRPGKIIKKLLNRFTI